MPDAVEAREVRRALLVEEAEGEAKGVPATHLSPASSGQCCSAMPPDGLFAFAPVR